MSKPIFTGAAVALVTPMHSDGSVNYEKLDELIEFYIGLGLTYECDWENFLYGDEYSERVRHIQDIKMDVWGRFLERPWDGC